MQHRTAVVWGGTTAARRKGVRLSAWMTRDSTQPHTNNRGDVGRLGPGSQERGTSAIGRTSRGGVSAPAGIRLYGCTWAGRE